MPAAGEAPEALGGTDDDVADPLGSTVCDVVEPLGLAEDAVAFGAEVETEGASCESLSFGVGAAQQIEVNRTDARRILKLMNFMVNSMVAQC